MPQGTVKFYNAVRGFGFIIPDDGSPDVYVNTREVEEVGIAGLSEGQAVEYEIAENGTKKFAIHIKLLSAANRRNPTPKIRVKKDGNGKLTAVAAKPAASSRTGTVKWFNTTKGYGFITPSGGGKDLFVYHTAVQGGVTGISEGDEVAYEDAVHKGRPCAANVARV